MNILEQLPALQVAIPFLAVPLVMLLRPHGFAWAAATATSICVFLNACALTMQVHGGDSLQYSMGSWPAPYGIELGVDSFSAILLLIITGASTLSLIGGQQSITSQIEAHRQPMFFAAWLLALAGLAGIVISADAFNIFVFMEISSLASYVLIAGGPDRRALPAVFRYLVMGTIGATFYLIGIGLIYMMTGTLNLGDMAVRIAAVADRTPVLVAAGFITVGLALKAAVFPLHAWLPNAYTHAPHIVTAFLAACATKVSLYVLLRFDFVIFQPNLAEHTLQFSWFLMPLAALAIVAGSILAVREQHLKRLLAYSSIAQIGYIMLAASLVSETGITAGVLHIFNHALAKGSLFLAVACLALRVASMQLSDLAGAARAMPWTMAAFVVAALSLIGVPGTAGFISKWYLITAALDAGAPGFALVAVIVLGSLMAVVYVWRVVETTCLATGDGAAAASEAPIPLLAATCLAAAANLYFGLATSLPVSLAASAAQSLSGLVP